MAKTSSSEVESLPPESCEALLVVLAAHGVLKSWQSTLRCPACNDTMSKEASYSCEDCQVTYHVRCLATSGFDIPLEQGGSGKQLSYGPRCTLCQVKREFSRRPDLTPFAESSNKAAHQCIISRGFFGFLSPSTQGGLSFFALCISALHSCKELSPSTCCACFILQRFLETFQTF